MFVFHLLKILFLDDFYSFLDFWFYHLPKNIFRKTINLIYSIDTNIGIRAHFRNIFKPFYGEKSFLLLLISLPFRILIILSGTILYSTLISLSLLLILFTTFSPVILFLIFLNILDYGILFRK